MPMLRLIDSNQRLCRIDDRNAFEHAKNSQIVVARNDQVGARGNRSRQNIVVVGVAADTCNRKCRNLLA